MPTITTDVSREARARRTAKRQGLRLVKSRRRDPHALDYGVYWIADTSINGVVAGYGDLGLSLDEVEAFLATDR